MFSKGCKLGLRITILLHISVAYKVSVATLSFFSSIYFITIWLQLKLKWKQKWNETHSLYFIVDNSSAQNFLLLLKYIFFEQK